MEEFVVKGRTRPKLGSRAAAKIRSEGLLPANVYGHKEANRNVALDYKEFEKLFHQGHRMLTLDVDGAREHGFVKEVQYDHLGSRILHVDIARVDLREKIEMNVPVETLGVAKGLTMGGTLDVIHRELPVEGPASSIPEKIEIPVAHLEVGMSVRVKDLTLPAECQFALEEEEVVVAMHEPRKPTLAQEEHEEAAEGELPEVISRKKDEEEEEKEGRNES